MKVLGKVTIFKNDKGNYSTSISNKKEDGTYDNMYIPVTLKKGINIDNKTNIDVTNGFLSFWTDKSNIQHIKVVILEFVNYKFTDEELPF